MLKKQILVVEDERIVAEYIKENLQNIGYSVPSIASSGAKAIKEVEDKSPDLVLMDIVLKGEMDGIETAMQIRSRFNIPVVYLTAYTDKKLLERAKITAPFGYITKPFNEKDLRVNIEIALYKHTMEKALQESEQRYATTLASIGEAVISTDVESHITFMNSEAEALTGWTLSEASTKPVTEVFKIINEYTRNETDNPATRVLHEGKIVGLANNTILIRKDGMEIPIDDSGAPIKDGDKTMGVVLVFHDITERKKSEEELRKYRIHLEKLVKERTSELEKKNANLEKLNRVFVGRELRMVELKKRIAENEKEIAALKSSKESK